MEWFIRATTKKGIAFVTEFHQSEAILIFKIFHDAAQKGEYPKTDRVPHTWRTEVFKEFMVSHGEIVMFELCEKRPDDCIVIYNRMWIEHDAEGRFKVKTYAPAGVYYTSTGLRPTDNVEEFFAVPAPEHEFHQVEMNGDFHMGFFEEPAEDIHPDFHGKSMAEVMAEFEAWEDEQDKITLEGHVSDIAINPEILKAKESSGKDWAGIFKDFVEKVDVPIITATQKSVNRGVIHNFDKFVDPPPFSSDLAPNVNAPVIKKVDGPIFFTETEGHETDMYSMPSIEPQYLLFVNGNLVPNLVLDDISFMKQLSLMRIQYNIHDIQGDMEMSQYLFDLLLRFVNERDIKIGAHPLDKMDDLYDGHDADHSIFWDRDEKRVLYATPLSDPPEEDEDDVFAFDDINF